MSINWSDDLATGVKLIDDQHIELFERINGLLQACRDGRGKDEIRRVMAFLETYVDIHFSEEEKHMTAYQYPEYASHKASHELFMKSFADLKGQFESEGPGVVVVVKANDLLVEWLKNHIRKIDKKLGEFLKTRL